MVNVGGYKSIRTHQIGLYLNGNKLKHFNSFGVEYISKEIEKIIENKNVIRNVFRIQAFDLTMCRYFRIGFIDFMLKSKSLLDYRICFF